MDKDFHARIESITQTVRQLKNDIENCLRAGTTAPAHKSRFRALFDDAPVGLAQVAADGRLLEVNRCFCDMLGYSREELLRLCCLDVTHPADRQTEERLRRALFSGEKPNATWEKRYIRKDGAFVWVSQNLSAPHAGDADAGYLLAAAENISERHTLQESLGRIVTNLGKTEAMSLSGTWTWDSYTGEVKASDDVFRIFELRPQPGSVPFSLFLERMHPNDRAAVNDAMHRAVAADKPFQIEHRVCLPDGTQRLVWASGDIYDRDRSGKPRQMVGILQDVTVRRQAELALKESEQRFRQLFDAAVDGIFIADRDGKYIDVNEGACRMLGFSRDELVGLHIADLLPERDVPRLVQAKSYLLENADHIQVADWELRCKDGSYAPVEISTRILPDGRWMAIVRDVSDRKRTQRELERYAEEVRDLYDNAPCGYHSIDHNGVIVRINRTELEWLGYTREELVGKRKITELMSDDSRRKFHEYFPVFLKSGRLRDVELELIRKDGSILPVMLSASAIRDEEGNFIRSRTTLFDMTELAEAQKKLRQAATVFDHTDEAIIVTDTQGAIVAVNKAFSRITGYPPEEVIGRNPRLLKSDRQDDAFYRMLWDALERDGHWQGEIWDRRKSGELFPTWQNITVVKDESGKITDYISVFSDITTIKATEEKLLKLAYQDPLTGLANRLLFNDRMTRAIAHARRHGTRIALLLLDLDRFKLINDTLGHAAGDELLLAISARLKDAVRAEDTIARLGGDEFAFILSDLSTAEEAALFARKIGKLITQPTRVAGQMMTISASIGISIYPDDAGDPETLSKCADIAMYSAKDKGRNAYEFYTQEMTQAATEMLAIDRGLRNAIRQNELVLYYQPQVNLSTGRIVGIEALIRWKNPALGLCFPGTFIPVAEESDLIESIGDWVFDEVCAQIGKWREAGLPPVRVAINVAVRQIRRAGFVEEMRQRLLACHPRGGFSMDIEITESALQISPDVIEALQELKSLGLKVSIDDFGTGYSSLNSLKHLPIDILKIDRSFIDGIPSDRDDKAITSTIIAIAHSMGMEVIAEGIETREQLQFVMGQQCDEAQGFFLFPPLSAHDCETVLASGGAVSHIETRTQASINADTEPPA